MAQMKTKISLFSFQVSKWEFGPLILEKLQDPYKVGP